MHSKTPIQRGEAKESIQKPATANGITRGVRAAAAGISAVSCFHTYPYQRGSGEGEGAVGFWIARRDQRWLKVTCAGPCNHSGAPAWTSQSWISGFWLWNVHLYLWPLEIRWNVGWESFLSWSGVWKKTSFPNTMNTKTLSRCHFLCRQSPNAAEEVMGRTAPRLNSRSNVDVSCFKITTVSHLHIYLQAEQDYSSQLHCDCHCCALWFWYVIIFTII